MKLPNSHISTETSGILDSNAFGIGDAGVILEILRTKIYKNPILAICREITCNARDAHREVGTPNRPIEVHLPNHWSTNITIKDYGPGISPDRMENIFIKFGSSTKRLDNIQTGGFGLGAKTPFAYSDTFTIHTVVDGIKYTYSAYIDESRVGKMTLLQREESDEPNGTAIEIPVLKDDYSTFVNQIVEVTQHWDLRPELHGRDDIPAWKTFEYVYTGSGWKLPKKPERRRNWGYYNDDRESIALIDGISYSIDPNSLSDADELQKAVLKTGFHFTFNVGDLSLAASRDSIHYDDDTQALLLKRVDALVDEIVVLITNDIKDAVNYTEACNAYEKVQQNLNHSGLLERVKGIQWQGHDIRLTVERSTIGKWARLVTYEYNSYDEKIKSNRRDKKIHFRNPSVLLYHHDIKNKSVPGYVIKHLLDDTAYSHMQVVWTEDEPTSSDYADACHRASYRNQDKPEVTYDKELMKLIGFKSLQEAVDATPKAARKKRKSRGKLADGEIMGYDLSVYYGDITTTSTSFPLDEGGVYIVVDYKNKEYKSGDKELYPNTVQMLKDFINQKVVGFTEFRQKKLGSEWVSLIDAAKAKMEEELKTITVAALSDAGKASNYLFEHHFSSLGNLALNKYLSKLDAECPIRKYIEESNQVSELLTKYKRLVPILRFFGHKVEDSIDYRRHTDIHAAPNCKLAKLRQEVVDRYALIGQLVANTDDKTQAIIEYIELIDEKVERDSNVFLPLTGTFSN